MEEEAHSRFVAAHDKIVVAFHIILKSQNTVQYCYFQMIDFNAFSVGYQNIY